MRMACNARTKSLKLPPCGISLVDIEGTGSGGVSTRDGPAAVSLSCVIETSRTRTDRLAQGCNQIRSIERLMQGQSWLFRQPWQNGVARDDNDGDAFIVQPIDQAVGHLPLQIEVNHGHVGHARSGQAIRLQDGVSWADDLHAQGFE